MPGRPLALQTCIGVGGESSGMAVSITRAVPLDMRTCFTLVLKFGLSLGCEAHLVPRSPVQIHGHDAVRSGT